jgi:ABC-type anion transport system duplicated permease subunit
VFPPLATSSDLQQFKDEYEAILLVVFDSLRFDFSYDKILDHFPKAFAAGFFFIAAGTAASLTIQSLANVEFSAVARRNFRNGKIVHK